MIITTTPSIEGHPVKEYKGIVTSEVIIGANAIRDFMAGIRDFFGGRSRTYEQVSAEARFNAFREIEQHAIITAASRFEMLHSPTRWVCNSIFTPSLPTMRKLVPAEEYVISSA